MGGQIESWLPIRDVDDDDDDQDWQRKNRGNWINLMCSQDNISHWLEESTHHNTGLSYLDLVRKTPSSLVRCAVVLEAAGDVLSA